MNELEILPDTCQRTIRVRGVVQGVGFRPTVWRYANMLGLDGHVRNDGEGVVIECAGPAQKIDQLLAKLVAAPPRQARIADIEQRASHIALSRGFVIAASAAGNDTATAVAPDLATCGDCLAEIRDPTNRRYRYPFTNCTNCGPRLSILVDLPYDRRNTSMARFNQCPECAREYHDPTDRRFHAQPNACPVCGPQLRLGDGQGAVKAEGTRALDQAIEALHEGKIIALKGIGGFQLLVDAANAGAVATLRTRKRRPHKPFALMARDLDVIAQFCEIDTRSKDLLASAAAPIVVMPRRSDSPALSGVAPQQDRLGFMLPTTPLHHLLLADLTQPVVMTSGNGSGEPQCIEDDQALLTLAAVADLFLLHNREVIHRVDDSVVQVVAGKSQVLRRARGYAPAPLPLPPGFDGSPQLIALGAELKNTFCLLHRGQAILSQHIGDLTDAVTLADFERSLARYRDLHDHRPDIVAVDQHPHYLSTRHGRELAATSHAKLAEIQHHHAHIAACLGDNGYPREGEPVLGLALDGVGYAQSTSGDSLWGGEVLLADYCQAKRLARLRPCALPGGNISMRQPWRHCLAQIHQSLGWREALARYGHLPLLQTLRQQPAATLVAMIDKGVNSPVSSSCGRLFDAVAAAVGIQPSGEMSYEGQAAMALQAAITDRHWQAAAPYPLTLERRGDLIDIDSAAMWPALLDDLEHGHQSGFIAARFHLGLAAALVNATMKLSHQYKVRGVALSGGCMQNPRLQDALLTGLGNAGLEVFTHRNIPANDGGIAYGQALVAAARALPFARGHSPCV